MKHKPQHPATKFWGLVLVFLIMTLVFALTASWFPQWSRIPGYDIPISTLGPYVPNITANSIL